MQVAFEPLTRTQGVAVTEISELGGDDEDTRVCAVTELKSDAVGVLLNESRCEGVIVPL